ncbi:hypothetical protein HZS_7119, partial [Henneguya salminicola]
MFTWLFELFNLAYNIKDYIFIISLVLVIIGLIAIILLCIIRLNNKRGEMNKYNSSKDTELNNKVLGISNKRPKNNFRIKEKTESGNILSDKHMNKLDIFSEYHLTDLNHYEDLSSLGLKEQNPITYLNKYKDILNLKDHAFLVENNYYTSSELKNKDFKRLDKSFTINSRDENEISSLTNVDSAIYEDDNSKSESTLTDLTNKKIVPEIQNQEKGDYFYNIYGKCILNT